MSDVTQLISAIDSGSSTDIESAFNEIFASKVSSAIDDMRLQTASTLFAEKQEVVNAEESVDQTTN